MFGYVRTDTPYLFIKDDTLYKAMYPNIPFSFLLVYHLMTENTMLKPRCFQEITKFSPVYQITSFHGKQNIRADRGRE